MKLLLIFNEWNHCSNTFQQLTVNFFKTLNIKILQILTLNIKKAKKHLTLNLIQTHIVQLPIQTKKLLILLRFKFHDV